MKKRGPIISSCGLGLLLISFLIVQSALLETNSDMSGQLLVPDVFEGMFEYTTEETQIFAGESNTFSFSTTKEQVPLLWGLQITNFEDGDIASIEITNIFGDNFGKYKQDEPIAFEMFTIQKNDIYNFVVTNNAQRPLSVIMMFSEDPQNSQAMTNPDSPFMKTVIPLAVSGIMVIAGVLSLGIGIILSLVDWKRGSKSKYI
ncbi:MAG: hypothetical protein FJ360_02535 [Thaumarchaeota archaeon]|nr:hypothetical protein [Nitrososphaerota archaeon]